MCSRAVDAKQQMGIQCDERVVDGIVCNCPTVAPSNPSRKEERSTQRQTHKPAKKIEVKVGRGKLKGNSYRDVQSFLAEKLGTGVRVSSHKQKGQVKVVLDECAGNPVATVAAALREITTTPRIKVTTGFTPRSVKKRTRFVPTHFLALCCDTAECQAAYTKFCDKFKDHQPAPSLHATLVLFRERENEEALREWVLDQKDMLRTLWTQAGLRNVTLDQLSYFGSGWERPKTVYMTSQRDSEALNAVLEAIPDLLEYPSGEEGMMAGSTFHVSVVRGAHGDYSLLKNTHVSVPLPSPPRIALCRCTMQGDRYHKVIEFEL